MSGHTTIRCPKCGAQGAERCATATGLDHLARTRAWVATQDSDSGPTKQEATAMGVSIERVCVRCGRRGVQQYVPARQDGTPAVTGESWVCANDRACRRRTADRTVNDETDTTAEVARVLAETSPCIWSIADPEHPYGEDFCLDDHPDKHPGVGFCWVLPTKQAKALAEAGLLAEEDTGTELLTREREDMLRDLHARYHDEVGNLLGRDECGWEGCEFWDAAESAVEQMGRAGLLRDDASKHVGKLPGTLYVQIEVTPHEWATRGQGWEVWNEATPQQAVQVLRDAADRWAREYGLEEPAAADDCGSCGACDPGLVLAGEPTGFPSRMSVCPDCGNKRCPRAADHRKWKCSGSNAVGQVGVPAEDSPAPRDGAYTPAQHYEDGVIHLDEPVSWPLGGTFDPEHVRAAAREIAKTGYYASPEANEEADRG
jgi:hypothetical protein